MQYHDTSDKRGQTIAQRLRERAERMTLFQIGAVIEEQDFPKEVWDAWDEVITQLDEGADVIEHSQNADTVDKVLARIDEATERFDTALLRVRNKPAVSKIPTTPPPFDADGKAVMTNNGPCHVLLEAIPKGGPNARKKPNGFKEVAPGRVAFQTPQHRDGDWTVYFDPQSDSPLTQWERVEGLSPLHTKVALFALAKICDPRNNGKHPNKKPIGISYKDLQRAIGLREMPMEEFKPLANRLVKDCSELLATVRGITMPDGKTDGIADCPVFYISKVWDERLFDTGEFYQIGWLIDPGMWAKYYFNTEAAPWLSVLQESLLGLDHRNARRAEVMALHIGTLLFVVAGGNQYKKRAITRYVWELLELAGELLEPEHRGAHWANRTAEALHVALETLRGARLVATVEYSPDYPDPSEQGKGWVERWLNATITLTTPEAAAFLEQDAPAPKAKLPPRLEKKLQRKPDKRPGERLDDTTAARLRAAIAHRFVNQEQAAHYFKCSRPLLSKVLNGQRTVNAELAAKFKALLDNQ